jgi:hypothetical protein
LEAVSVRAAAPSGVVLIAIFFAVATCILVGVGAALLFPGSEMEMIWRTYPARRALPMPYREWLGPGLLAHSLKPSPAKMARRVNRLRARVSPPRIGLIIGSLNPQASGNQR